MTIPAIALMMLLSISAQAQDAIPDRLTLQGSFGTVTKDGSQWQRFSFRPDIPIGEFGLGLDLELFIDDEGRLSDEGWDFSTSNRTWDTILRKIYYVRYGSQFDRVYFRAGALDDVTLGYGLIMDGYTNALTYPADKNLGLDLALRDIGTFGIGVRAMINALGDLKNDGLIGGVRITAKPFMPTGRPVLGRLTFGVTVVRDANQFAGLDDADEDGYPDYQDGFPDDKKRWEDTDGDGFEDSIDIDVDGDNVLDSLDPQVDRTEYVNIHDNRNGFTAAGFDVAMPLIDSPVQLDIYGQFARLIPGDEDLDGGWGTGVPGVRLIAGDFLGQLEYRHFEGRFRSGYFDNLYDHERVRLVGGEIIRKEQTLPDVALNGFYGKAGWEFMDMFYAQAGYQYMTGTDTYQDLSAVARLMPDLLDMIPKLTMLEAYFYNRYVNTGEYGLFDFTSSTLYGTRIGISLGTGVSAVWNTRYTFTPKTGGGFEKQRFVSIETVITMN